MTADETQRSSLAANAALAAASHDVPAGGRDFCEAAFAANATLAASLALQDAVAFVRNTYALALAAVASRANGPAGEVTTDATHDVSRLLDLGIKQLNAVLDFGARVERVTTRAVAEERPAADRV